MVHVMVQEERLRSKMLYKITILLLKVIPMLLAICAVTNTMLDFAGIESTFLSIVGGISVLPLMFLYLASFAFCFCVYHRMFLDYILVNNLLTWFDYYIGIPISNKSLLALHIAIVGLFLFLILYFHQKEKCCKR